MISGLQIILKEDITSTRCYDHNRSNFLQVLTVVIAIACIEVTVFYECSTVG